MLTTRITNSAIVFVSTFVLTFVGCQNTGVESPTGVDELSAENSSGALSKNYAHPIHGSALFFDGIDDYVVVPDDPSLDMTDGFTVAAWIYLEEYVEWASIVTKGGLPNDAGDANNYAIHQSGTGFGPPVLGHLRFTHQGATFPRDSDSIIPLQEWHYAAITFDGHTLRFYLDGVPDGEHPFDEQLLTNDEPLHIGVDFPIGDEYWHGLIDEVRIWNKPLKKAHVRAAMHGHSSPLASALVGYWRFDEGSGNVAHDRSRYRNHGQLMGNPTWVSSNDAGEVQKPIGVHQRLRSSD